MDNKDKVNKIIKETLSSFNYKKELASDFQFLINRNRFYGVLLQKFTRKFTQDVPIAGVNVEGTKLNLFINPFYFFFEINENMELVKRSLNFRLGVLEHEVGHIIGLHILRKGNRDHKIWNMATDITINDRISALRDLSGICTSKNLEVEKGRHAEYYYDELIKKQEKFKENNSGSNPFEEIETIDDHSIWENGESSKELKKEVIKKALKSAISDAKKNGLEESIPGEAFSSVKYLESVQVSWKQEIQKFGKSLRDKTKKNVWTKLNRRIPYYKKGKKYERKSHIACIIDTSASVSDKEISVYQGEMSRLMSRGAKISLILADVEVSDVLDYKKGMKEINFKGRGGTAYDAPIKKAKSLGVDGIIYFGDMDCFDTPKDPNIPVLWISTGSETKPGNFGKLIKISVDND